MVSLHKIDEQLKQIGASFSYWGRRELRELSKIMTETEEIKQVVNGHYQGGFAMLVATDQRLLLIDRKPMFLTVEAIWYDKIGQVDFNHRLLNASICVSTPNKDLHFTSWNNVRLRDIMLYTQEKMNEVKNYDDRYFRGRVQNYQPEYFKEPERYTVPAKSVGARWSSESSVEQDLSFSESRTPVMTYSLPSAKTRLPYSRRRYFAGGEA